MKTLDIDKYFLCTAKTAHLESDETKETKENIIRDIFALIVLDISAAIRYHCFKTYFSCALDLERYADDIIPILKELGYQVELLYDNKNVCLCIKW